MHSLLVKLDRSVFTLLLIASIWGFDKVSEKGFHFMKDQTDLYVKGFCWLKLDFIMNT